MFSKDEAIEQEDENYTSSQQRNIFQAIGNLIVNLFKGSLKSLNAIKQGIQNINKSDKKELTVRK